MDVGTAIAQTAAARADIEDRLHHTLDVTVEQLLWYNRLPGTSIAVEGCVHLDEIPEVLLYQIANTWILAGQRMTSALRTWIETFLPQTIVADLVDAAARRRLEVRGQTLTDLRAFLEIISALHPYQIRIPHVITQVQQRHAAARTREVAHTATTARQPVLFPSSHAS